MKNTMRYKNYIGSVEYSEEDDCFCGQVIGIRDLIVFEGTDVKSLRKDFEENVELYLQSCREKGREPQISYKGSMNIRIPTELHMNAARLAISDHMTLNALITKAIDEYVGRRMAV